MELSVPGTVPAVAMSCGIHGDPALLVEAARRLRLGIERGVYRSQPPGEYAMFGLARLLDAIAFSMQSDGGVHHTVVAGTTEIAHHVLTYLHPTPDQRRQESDRGPEPSGRERVRSSPSHALLPRISCRPTLREACYASRRRAS